MRGLFQRATDRLLGRGGSAITVPPMDGAIKPNSVLDEATGVAFQPEPDNLVLFRGVPLFSSAHAICTLDGRPAGLPLSSFAADIVALAASPSGVLAVALSDGSINICGGDQPVRTLPSVQGKSFKSITTMRFLSEDVLLVTEGSAVHGPQHWQRDLLEQRPSGSLWRIQLATGEASRLLDRLAFPYGILLLKGGNEVLVSESWKHRVIKASTQSSSPPEVVLEDLPGYPARLEAESGGGAWLCVFSPRSQLIEFTLREKKFRSRMMQEVASPYWIAPQLRSGVSFREPLQGGGVKQMGILKPWAPTRSYGLVIKLGPDFLPTASFHSRADGKHHGITSCLEQADSLLVTSKGGDVVLAASLNEGLEAQQ